MKRTISKKVIYVIAAVLLINNAISAQDKPKDEFKPSGKPFAKVFSNFHTGLTHNNVNSAFEITRAYLGYKYKMSENWSANLTLDVGNPKNGSALEQTAYIKVGALTYKKENLTFNFGLIGLKQFKVQEKFWARRFLYKSFQDQHKFNASADLGANIDYKIHKKISIDATIQNGEGYKKLQSDDTYRGGLGLTINPFEALTLRAYYDMMQKTETQSSLATFIGYNHKDKIFLGVEYNMQNNTSCVKDLNRNGISVYTAYAINKKFELFARYDQLASNTLAGATNAWNVGKDGEAVIGGLQYNAVKGVKIALNYQSWFPEASGAKDAPNLYLNFEYAF